MLYMFVNWLNKMFIQGKLWNPIMSVISDLFMPSTQNYFNIYIQL